MDQTCAGRIAVDVGGTFTDMVLLDDNSGVQTFKVPSVPEDPSQGVLNVLDHAASRIGISLGTLLRNCRTFVHGSTVATNIMLEGKGARVGLLVTHGFRDSLEIRRGHRRDVWNHREPFAPVLVPRYLRLPVRGRIGWDGEELEPFCDDDVVDAMAHFIANGVEAICVSFLHSYANRAHEDRARKIVQGILNQRDYRCAVCTSSEISSVIGEYGRTSTAVINAYLIPKVSGYLRRLAEELSARGLDRPLLMQQSNGGAIPVTQAIESPVNLLFSGPSAVIGALNYLAGAYVEKNLISVEIGGTSTDVTMLHDGSYSIREQIDVAGYPVTIPAIDIHTVAAGGGSIATVDSAGMMRVGPEGAGASPGPAAFGLGGEHPTVTDAHLLLGRLKSGSYANGHVNLNFDLARQAVEKAAARLNVTTDDAAVGIIRIANQHIKHAVERISIERGVDARCFALVAGGGAGPMHGMSVARSLGMTKVVVPRQSGALCAFGMLNGDVRQDFLTSCLEPLNETGITKILAYFEDMRHPATEFLKAQGFDSDHRVLVHELSLRYFGQQWDVRVCIEDQWSVSSIRAQFEQIYERLYGHVQPDGQVEVCAAHLIAFGKLQPITPKLASQSINDISPISRRRVYFDESGWVDDVPIYFGPDLTFGFKVLGPAIIEESTTTINVPPGDQIEVGIYGDYIIHVRTEKPNE